MNRHLYLQNNVAADNLIRLVACFCLSAVIYAGTHSRAYADDLISVTNLSGTGTVSNTFSSPKPVGDFTINATFTPTGSYSGNTEGPEIYIAFSDGTSAWADWWNNLLRWHVYNAGGTMIGYATVSSAGWTAGVAETLTITRNGNTFTNTRSNGTTVSWTGTLGTTVNSIMIRDQDHSTTAISNGRFSGIATGTPNCIYNGQQINNGSSVTAYQTSEAQQNQGQSCVSQQRTCTNGTLSGNYQYASCNLITPELTPVTAAMLGVFALLLGWQVCRHNSRFSV